MSASKITKSNQSFKNPSTTKAENNFIFILEDLNLKKAIGVSMIHGQHGTPSKPHFFLRVGNEIKHSTTLKKKYVYETLKLSLIHI